MASHDDIMAVIRSALELPDDAVITADMEPSDVPGWDSAGWIKVVAAIETELGIETPFDKLDTVKTVGDFLGLLA